MNEEEIYRDAYCVVKHHGGDKVAVFTGTYPPDDADPTIYDLEVFNDANLRMLEGNHKPMLRILAGKQPNSAYPNMER